MFKPLLRTSPLYSGNIKIACNCTDYNRIEKNVYECNIRSAKLYPLSHQLFQKNIDCGLLGSSYEFDLKKFYESYSDYFYENCFEYMKNEMSIIDYASSQYQRNTDFEYGVKRVSYQKTGYQYAFFAPIYIENINDIPNAFVIDLEFSFSGKMKLNKRIQVNIACNKDSIYNYIYSYLSKYANRIDDNVAYVSQVDNSAVYFGIDCENGGFVKKVDKTLQSLFIQQSTLNNFDAVLSLGFKRGKMVMKQILPLCFMFNIDDILTGTEQTKYKNCDIICSGYYLDSKYNKNVEFYDFSFDYDYFYQTIKLMDESNGMLTEVNTNINLQDVNFPSLNERRLQRYQFSNKLTQMYSRWKLKYSSDDYPYIINLNYAYSKNQDSSYNYREFPTNFRQCTGLCNVLELEDTYVFNFVFPLGEIGIKYYRKYLPDMSTDYDSNLIIKTYQYLKSILSDFNNEIMSKIWDLYNNVDELSVSQLELATKEFYQDTFGIDDSYESYLYNKSYHEDLKYLYDKIVSPTSDINLENVRKKLLESNNLKITLAKTPEKYKEWRNEPENLLNTPIEGDDERDFYDIIYSHYNGDYFSTNLSDKYAVKVINAFPMNVLFVFILAYAKEKAIVEINNIEQLENTSIISKYKQIRNNYSCDWFSIVYDIEKNEDWYKSAEWLDVIDNKCYYRGILYDMNNIYNMLEVNKFEKIDKFGVFVYPEFNPLSDNENSEIIYSTWAVGRTKGNITARNCEYNPNMLVDGIVNGNATYIFSNEENVNANNADWQYNKQFKRITYDNDAKLLYNPEYDAYYYNTEKIAKKYDKLFVSLEDTNLLYSDVNKYYDVTDFNYIYNEKYSISELKRILSTYTITNLNDYDISLVKDMLFTHGNNVSINSAISGFELLPVNNTYMLADKSVWAELEIGNNANLVNQICIESPYIENAESTYAHIDTSKYFDNCWQPIADQLYISTQENRTRIQSAYNYNSENPEYSYIWDGPEELCKVNHGVNLYRKGSFVKAVSIEEIKDKDFSNSFIENYIVEHCKPTGGESDYFDADGKLKNISALYPSRKINTVKSALNILRDYLADNMLQYLYDIDEYEFNPLLLKNNGTEYASTVFTKRLPDTSRFYGQKMDENELPYDIDCLWLDTYNLGNIFKGRVIDKEQIFPAMPKYVQDMLGHLENNNLGYWRHEFFAKFSSKAHIYHYFIELGKDYAGDMPVNFMSNWENNIYVRMRRLVNNESINEYNKELSSANYDTRQKSFKLSIEDQYMTFGEYMNGYYEGMNYSDNFIRFYIDNLHYDSSKDLYYVKTTSEDGEITYKTEYFELLFKKDFIRLNSDVWKELLRLFDNTGEQYRDLYIYRLQSIDDYENKYKNYLTIKYVNLEGVDTEYAKYLPGSFKTIDQCLVPLFNDIFDQDRKDTELYSNYVIQNISETKVYGNKWDEPDKYGYKDSIYRYEKNNASIIVELVEYDIDNLIGTTIEAKSKYITTKIDEDGSVTGTKGKEYRYIQTPFEYATGNNILDCLLERYTACNMDFYDDRYYEENKAFRKYDQLGYIESSEINSNLTNENINLKTIVGDDGTKYGFYLIKLVFDNTVSTFNLGTIHEMQDKQTGEMKIDYNANIKFFKYMNGFNIVDEYDNDYFENYPVRVIRELMPFMKISPLDLLNDMACVVKPKMYSMQNIYSQNLIKNVYNGPEELTLEYKPSYSRQSLLRYMNSITPLITLSNNIVTNQYNLKFKNVQARLLDEGLFNSIGDSVIYKDNMYINNYHPIQVYTINNSFNQGTNSSEDSTDYNKYFNVKSYNMIIENFVPMEYKHYNNSKVLNLPTYFEIKHTNNVTYDKLKELETDDYVFNIFKGTIKNLIEKFPDNRIDDYSRYMFNKYDVSFDTQPIGLNHAKNEKIYKLTYKFELL